MRNETLEPTGTRPVLGGRIGRATAALAVVVGVGLVTAGPAHAGLGDPLDPGRPTTTEAAEDGEPTTTTTEAETPTTTEGDAPATTAAETPSTDVTSDDDGPVAVEDDDDDGTSVAALGAVGVVAFVLGLIVAGIPLMIALSKRKAAPAAPAVVAPAPATPPAPAGPAPTPAPAAGPTIGAPPSRDADQVRSQRVALVEGLIALRDKLPSEALAGEAAAALAAAGITELNPLGQRFDPTHHKAVDQVPADDPSRHGTITAVERLGYSDGAAVIRQPEVVVAVHGGSS